SERNIWRSSQIRYQQARRQYMLLRDNISFDVRTNLRNLQLNRFQFEITREQLITAARQVEQAQTNLRSSREADSNLTRDLLTALQSLLRARNSLISSWVNYETSRMRLYRTLGVLFVDDAGKWINDGQSFHDFLSEPVQIDETETDTPDTSEPAQARESDDSDV
ncbi:MAG: TolC family protein, partial [Planctomycetaceae bacterium]|nr:TolC family protein [Planctomycetaceae bacterium]